jgi:hypothetical protein
LYVSRDSRDEPHEEHGMRKFKGSILTTIGAVALTIGAAGAALAVNAGILRNAPDSGVGDLETEATLTVDDPNVRYVTVFVDEPGVTATTVPSGEVATVASTVPSGDSVFDDSSDGEFDDDSSDDEFDDEFDGEFDDDDHRSDDHDEYEGADDDD